VWEKGFADLVEDRDNQYLMLGLDPVVGSPLEFRF